MSERRDAAGLAEPVVPALAAELVVRRLGVVRQQPELRRLDDRAPVAPLGADRAIAAAGAGAEVDVGLVADLSAVAAAAIGFLHPSRVLSGFGFTPPAGLRPHRAVRCPRRAAAMSPHPPSGAR